MDRAQDKSLEKKKDWALVLLPYHLLLVDFVAILEREGDYVCIVLEDSGVVLFCFFGSFEKRTPYTLFFLFLEIFYEPGPIFYVVECF